MIKSFSLILLIASMAWGALEVDLGKVKHDTRFFATGRPGLSFQGKLNEKKGPPLSGKLKIDKNSVLGKAIFRMDVFETGIGLRDTHMNEKYLQTDKFPLAELTITSLDLGDGWQKADFSRTVEFSGTLLLHGQSKPVSGKVLVEQTSDGLQLHFSYTLLLDKFNIDMPSYMVVKMNNDVRVETEVTLPSALLKANAA